MMKVLAVCLMILGASLLQTRADTATENWAKDCAKCHGPDGKGLTRMGKKLAIKDLTDPKVQAGFTDEQAATDIKNGVTENGRKRMPGYADTLGDADVKALVAHIRSLKKGA